MGEGFKVQRQQYVSEPGVIYLYNVGDECTSLTGGWSNTIAESGTAYPTLEANHIRKGSSSIWSSRGTANKIDFSLYETLYVEAQLETQRTGSNPILIPTITSSLDNWSAQDANVVAQLLLTPSNMSTALTVYSTDISSVSGLYYLTLKGGNYSVFWAVTRIWVE